MKYLLFPLIVLALLAASPAGRLDQWHIIGPGGGGAMFVPTISPHDARRVLVGCDMTGSYISNDAGESWRMFNLRERARLFVFDPKDPDTIYVGANGLWRSVDAGKTWTLVYPDPKTVTGAKMPDDHAEFELLTTDKDSGRITALAIAPHDSNLLYAASRALNVSRNRGMSWEKLVDLPGMALKVAVTGETVYAIGRDFLATCRAGQCGFTKTPGGFVDTSIAQSTFYGITSRDIFISTDAGSSWRKSPLREGVEAGTMLSAIAASEQHPETAYVSYKSLNDGDHRYFGVAKTVDTGSTWELVWKESSTAAPNIHDVWVSARFGPSWGGNPLSLGVAPANPNIVYGTDLGRTLRSTDGGKTWTGVYSAATWQGTFATNGLDVTTSYGVHVDPFNRNRMFISYTDIGLFRSDDGGKSWTSATVNGVPRRWVNTTYWMVFDPAVRGRAWAVMSGPHDLPRTKMWRRTSVQSYQGGVVASDDGGNTWRVSNAGMEPTAATHILLDPHSPAGRRVLYVAGFGRGVYKTADGGETWSLNNDGLPGPEPFAWRLAQDRDGVLYLILARRSEDGSYGNSGDGALYRSTDGAARWQRIELPAGVNGPNGLAIDPEDPKRLYLAAWGRKTAEGAVDGGIWTSKDGGGTWRNVLDRDQHVYDITIDPRHPDILYACGFESSAWRSSDRGKTWTRIRGYNFKWGHRVIPDPLDASKIYITTFGGSVWHGPASGDPSAPEDIATPQLAYSK